MMPSSPLLAGGCSPTPNGDFSGRCLLGRFARTCGLGAGLASASHRHPRGCSEPEPFGHGSLRPTHQQFAVGECTWKRAVDCRDDRTAERLSRKRLANHRSRPITSRRTHRPDHLRQSQFAVGWHRRRSRTLEPQAASDRSLSTTVSTKPAFKICLTCIIKIRSRSTDLVSTGSILPKSAD